MTPTPNFNTGNSGNLLREAVVKTGDGCQMEGAYCQLLGSEVCPEVYAIIPNGYVMERLSQPHPTMRSDPKFLRAIAFYLEKKVWSRPALHSTMDTDWRDKLKIYGIRTPDWIIPNEYCMVHGDPTVSNVLIRGRKVIIADPRPPRDYIPQCRETDLGRILQSWYGWEVAAYGAPGESWDKPDFRTGIEEDRAHFWCGAAAARIEYLENSRDKRPIILDWCRTVRSLCHV
jgi:hypothetical protein